ncbi:MAG: DUF1592 domain-containing protein [Lentisphaeraceae bacterium]|nr:DUF1592 domain-containing protein [Lentisphaeraceae bacterium]
MKFFIIILVLSTQYLAATSFNQIMKNHCVNCHGGSKTKGDVNLTVLDSKESFYTYYDMLKSIYSQVESGEMPPEKKSKMTADERKFLVDYLSSFFEKLENTDSQKTGPTRIRRLTAYEYDNTVKHITGLDLNLSENFTVDGGGGEGFTNDSAILGVSPLQFEKYLQAAEVISTHSRFDVNKGFSFTHSQDLPKTKQQSIEQIKYQMNGVIARIRPPDFNYERYLPKLMLATNDYNLSRNKAADLPKILKGYKVDKYSLKKALTYFSTSSGKAVIERDALQPWFKLRQNKYDKEMAQELAAEFTKVYLESFKKVHEVKGLKKRSYTSFQENIEKLFTYSTAELALLVKKEELEKYQKLASTKDLLEKGMRSKYRSVFAKQLMPQISDFMLKVHRYPPDKAELLEMTKDFIKATGDFGIDVAARLFVIRSFASMKFIFRFERKTGKPTKVNDYELASRLSYFIWSMPPDGELMKLAKEKKLSEPKVLEAQVKRLIKNKKSSALAKNFGAQWLKYGEILESEGPSKDKFPEFNKSLAKDMYKESAICFEYLVKADRSVLEVIDSDYSFMNSKLERYYGIGEGFSGFKKVSLKDKNRGGILGHASILTLTSYPQRTSPVLRGNWIINALLGTPTPPPPANVDILDDEEQVTEKLSLKDQLAKHRDSPNCASCHQRIDPLGFPLENYDPIGRWRDKYTNAPIDAVGELKTGKKLDGPQDLKKYLLKNKDLFLKNMSRKLLGYALGRKVYHFDYYIINKMVESAQKKDYRFSALVTEIVNSYQFQHKN